MQRTRVGMCPMSAAAGRKSQKDYAVQAVPIFLFFPCFPLGKEGVYKWAYFSLPIRLFPCRGHAAVQPPLLSSRSLCRFGPLDLLAQTCIALGLVPITAPRGQLSRCFPEPRAGNGVRPGQLTDRKSTRLN